MPAPPTDSLPHPGRMACRVGKRTEKMVATFFTQGRGHSVSAMTAHAEGRFPLSRAIGVVAKAACVNRAAAKAALEATFAGEWHHVGKFAATVDYYDTSVATAWLAARPDVARLEAVAFQDIIAAAIPVGFMRLGIDQRRVILTAAFAAVAELSGVAMETIRAVYFCDWADAHHEPPPHLALCHV